MLSHVQKNLFPWAVVGGGGGAAVGVGGGAVTGFVSNPPVTPFLTLSKTPKALRVYSSVLDATGGGGGAGFPVPI